MAKAEDNIAQLHNFFNQNNKRKFEEPKSDQQREEEIELTLGLSLNGHFGFDPGRSHMVRSASVSNFDFAAADSGGADVALGRTMSMPTEMEWRRRKEEQSVWRMEAKRKRVGKMMNEKGMWPMRDQHVAVVSHGSGLSGVLESETRTVNQVASVSVEARSSGSVQSLPNQYKTKQTPPIEGTKTDITSTKPNNHDAKEMMKNMMVNMPCVSTRGVGSKRIEGFLYRYSTREEVRIVCVCHGSFLSPAEFVKHAGGGDVSQPLKHIVVDPFPLL